MDQHYPYKGHNLWYIAPTDSRCAKDKGRFANIQYTCRYTLTYLITMRAKCGIGTYIIHAYSGSVILAVPGKTSSLIVVFYAPTHFGRNAFSGKYLVQFVSHYKFQKPKFKMLMNNYLATFKSQKIKQCIG